MTFHLGTFINHYLKKHDIAYILTLNPILLKKIQDKITNNNIDIDEKDLSHNI